VTTGRVPKPVEFPNMCSGLVFH